MPSVGTAYVNIRVNTKGFKASLTSAMSGLKGDMKKVGTDLGNAMVDGMAKANADKAFKPIRDSVKSTATVVDRESKKMGDSMDRAALNIADASDLAADHLQGLGDQASDTRGALGRLGGQASNTSRSLSAVGGAGGRAGGGLRSGGDGANFFIRRLQELSSEADRNKTILHGLFNMAAFGGTAFAGLIGAASGAAQGIFAVGASAASAAPALATMTNGILSLIQVGSVMGLAMQGAGGALTAGFAAAEKGAVAATDSVGGMGEATAAASRAVRDAKQALAQAYDDAADAARDAAQQTVDAEHAVAEAHQETAAAQRELNLARAEALEQIEDIGFAAEDAAIAEDRAALALQDARRELIAVSELAPNDRTRVEAELNFKEADLAYRQAKDRRQDTVKEQNEVAKKGIEGTDAMKDARDNLASAEEAEADAVRDLIDARRNEAEVAEDNAEAIADAQQNLADAQRDLTGAQNKGTEAMQAAATAVDEYQTALDKLGPNAREFVERIVGMREEFEAFRNRISEPLFGSLLTAMDRIAGSGLIGVIEKGLTGTSEALGRVAERASTVATSDAFKSSLGDAMEYNNTAIRKFGRAGVNLADAFVQIADAAGPLFVDLAEWVRVTARGWKQTLRADNESGKLTKTFERAAERVKEFWGLAKQLWRTLTILGGAANKASNQFKWFDDQGREKRGYIPSLTYSLKQFNKELDKGKNKPGLIAGFDQALKNLNATGRAFKNAILDPFVSLGKDKGIEEAMNTIAESEAFDTLAKTAGDAVPELADLVVSIADILANMSKSGAIDNFLSVLTFVADQVARFTGLLADSGLLKWIGYVTGAAAATRVLWTVLKLGTSPFVGLAKGAFDFTKKVIAAGKAGKGFFGSIGAGFKKDPKDAAKARKAGADVSDAFADGLRTGMTKVEAAMEALELKVRTNFTEMTPKLVAKAVKVGQDIMEGLETGIRTGTVEAKAAAFKAGRDVADDVGDGAGTQSPSTITLKDGNDLMEGLELGIKSGTAEARLAATTAGRSVGTAVGTSAKTAAATSSVGIGASMSGGVATGMAKSGGVSKIGGAFSKMLTPLKAVARGFGGLMTLAMGPFGIAIEVILLLLPLLIPLFQKIEEKTGIFSKTLDVLTSAFKWLWGKLKEGFNWVKDNWPLLLAILFGPFGLAIKWIIENWDTLMVFVKAIPDKIKSFLSGMWDIIKDKLAAAWDWVKSTFGKIVAWVKKVPQRIWSGLKNLWEVIKDKLSDAWEWVKRTWGRIVTWVKGRPAQFMANLRLLWDVVKDKLADAWDWVKSTWDRIVTWVKERPAQFTRTLKHLWDVFQDTLADAWQWVKDKWDDIKNEISSWPGEVKNKLSGIWNGLKEGLADGLNWVGEKLNSLIGKLNDLLGKFGIPKISFQFETHYVARAEGGPIVGPGGPKDDRIPALLSNGEYVLPTKAARKLGRRSLDYMRTTGELPPGTTTGTGGILGWVADKYNDLQSALKKGAEVAFNWVLSWFKGVVGENPSLIPRVALGFVEWASEKIVGIGKKEDRQAARRERRASQAGAQYHGPPGGWTYPLGVRYGITQMPNAGHSPSWSVDIGAPSGTLVRAATRGTVATVIDLGGSSYGKYIVVSHAGGESTLYAHLRSFAVRAGQRVSTGQRLGYSDSTGNSTGPHLHFEVRPSSSTYAAMKAHGVTLGRGGVVAPSSTGTLAVIAEAGKHERVTPLDSEGFTPAERRMLEALENQVGGGGDQYHVHPAAGMDESALADKVARRVAWKRRRGAGWR